MYQLQIKRIYQPIEASDGFRILVDRLWPRGIKKEDAHINLWEKRITPTSALRKWFNHQPEKFAQFALQYQQELAQNPQSQDFLTICQQQLEKQNVTLLYAAKDPKCNHALILSHWVLSQLYHT